MATSLEELSLYSLYICSTDAIKRCKTNIHSSVSHLSMDKHISLLQNNGRKLVASSFWESVNNSNHAQRIPSYFPSFKTLQPKDKHNFAAGFIFQTVTSFIVRASLTTP